MLAVVQFDAVSVPLVERLLEEGRMPQLADLRARGTTHVLQSPAEHFAGASFHTLYTGLEPGRHGLYYAFQWDPAAQRVRPAESFAAPEAAWERLDRLGARCLALDLYEARRPEGFGGSFAAGIQFANRVAMPARSTPKALGRELRRSFGRPPDGEEVFGRPTLGSLRTMTRAVRQGPGRLARGGAELLGRGRYDCAWFGLCAGHLAGHWLWDASQLSAHDREAARREGFDAVLDEVYERLDTALGSLVDALPDDADVLVVSALGMAENSSRSDLLPGMLDAVLGGREGSGSGAERNGRPHDGGSIWRLRSRVPTGLRARIANALPDRVAVELTARMDLRDVDWTRTRAFPLAGDHHGHVRLNLRGRERDGIVDPADADALVEEIAVGLQTFTDPDGRPAVESVVRTRDVADGPLLDRLPDLVVRWSEAPATDLVGVGSPEFGDVVRLGGGSGTGRSGGHTGDAWVTVVPGRSRLRERLGAPAVADVAVTAIALFGGETDDLDGEPLLEPA